MIRKVVVSGLLVLLVVLPGEEVGDRHASRRDRVVLP